MKPITKPKVFGNPKMYVAGLLVFLAWVGNLGAQTAVTYTYDALGRLTFVSDPVNGNRDYDYDKAGNRQLVSVGTANDSAAEPGSGTSIPITNGLGAVLPAAASLYTVLSNCVGSPASCTWVLRKLYGDQGVVVVVVHAPYGSSPACWSGVTAQITSGYVRGSCFVTALSTVYGQ